MERDPWGNVKEAMAHAEGVVNCLGRELPTVSEHMAPKLEELVVKANRLYADIESYKAIYEASLMRGE